MISTIIAATTLTSSPALDDDTAEGTFWKSVYEEDHVIEIEISLTKAAWEKMQPTRSERGGRGARDGGPSREGRPERPDLADDASAVLTSDGSRSISFTPTPGAANN